MRNPHDQSRRLWRLQLQARACNRAEDGCDYSHARTASHGAVGSSYSAATGAPLRPPISNSLNHGERENRHATRYHTVFFFLLSGAAQNTIHPPHLLLPPSEVSRCVTVTAGFRKKILYILAARATLHIYPAATPASLITPSTCLAARPLVLYYSIKGSVGRDPRSVERKRTTRTFCFHLSLSYMKMKYG